MANNTIVKPVKKNRVQKYSYCPQCGMKGLYHVQQQYCRCRYCGLYRISLPGQDFLLKATRGDENSKDLLAFPYSLITLAAHRMVFR